MKKIEILTMSHIIKTFILLATIAGLSGCEDVIDLKTTTGPAQLVVDGWITDQPGQQTITLSWSAAYFDNSAPKPYLDAKVTVTDDLGKVYEFTDDSKTGNYTWGKLQTDTLGHIGRKYTLTIQSGADVFTAKNEIKRVPKIDSLIYTNETYPFKPDKGQKKGYILEFYARDFPGVGDTYWIKPVINGKVIVDKAINLSIAYDAAFGAGTPSDGLIFIQPIRRSLTTDSLFQAGNHVGAELHSITNEAYYFIQEVQNQSNNGGLFATPLANIKSNVSNNNPDGPKALGYFGASAVSRMETIIDPAKAKPEED